jgi:acyl-CoA synthetase (AMP-forming)/AMP-acid ligase II/acyl carrier protein
MLCGGEPLAPEMARQLLGCGGALWNMYGPTETTIWSSVERVRTAEPPISIGRPIPGTKLAVVDRWGQLLPVGVPGELYIGGRGVARGYWRRPELTAERFVRDAFSDHAEGRFYRTGDLARYLPDGRLECLGRLDDQVKVRGFRIELGDIEAALERHPAVKQAVASVQADAAGDRRLVAYVLPTPGGDEATASELRRFLRQELPDYMVPSLFVTVETIPLTANGKVDRRSLPSPFGQTRRSNDRVAPRTPVEQEVAAIWSEVLDRPDVSVHDNFFDIGGHSLLSMEAIAGIEKRLGVRLHPAQFMLDTLEQISATCEQMRRTSGARVES